MENIQTQKIRKMLQISALRKITYLTLWKILGIGMESGQKNGFC